MHGTQKETLILKYKFLSHLNSSDKWTNILNEKLTTHSLIYDRSSSS